MSSWKPNQHLGSNFTCAYSFCCAAWFSSLKKHSASVVPVSRGLQFLWIGLAGTAYSLLLSGSSHWPNHVNWPGTQPNKMGLAAPAPTTLSLCSMVHSSTRTLTLQGFGQVLLFASKKTNTWQVQYIILIDSIWTDAHSFGGASGWSWVVRCSIWG